MRGKCEAHPTGIQKPKVHGNRREHDKCRTNDKTIPSHGTQPQQSQEG